MHVRQTRPEDWPLWFWEMENSRSLGEAKAWPARLADQHVPVILGL